MAETIIGTTVVIDGEVSGSDNLVVRGIVRGAIRLEQELLVEQGGLVEAQVDGGVVDVAGILKGNVVARQR